MPIDPTTLRGVTLEVYRVGVVPPIRTVIARWRAVPAQPLRALPTLLITVLTLVRITLYVLLALLVPATVLFLLAITAPVLLWVGVSNLLDGSWPGRA